MAEGTINILYNWIEQGFDAVKSSLAVAQEGTIKLTATMKDLSAIAKSVGLDFIDMGINSVKSFLTTAENLNKFITDLKTAGQAVETINNATETGIAIETTATAVKTASTVATATNTTTKATNTVATTANAGANTLLTGATLMLASATNILTASTITFMGVTFPLWAVLIALAGIAFVLKAAWEANFLGIADLVEDTFGFIMELFDDIFYVIVDFFEMLDSNMGNFDILRLLLLPLIWPLELLGNIFGFLSEKIDEAGGVLEIFSGPLSFVSNLINVLAEGLEFLYTKAEEILSPFMFLKDLLEFIISPLSLVTNAASSLGEIFGMNLTTAASENNFGSAATNTYIGGSNSNKNLNFNTSIYGAEQRNMASLSEQYLSIVSPQIQNQV
jgi:hypothetical protein